MSDDDPETLDLDTLDLDRDLSQLTNATGPQPDVTVEAMIGTIEEYRKLPKLREGCIPNLAGLWVYESPNVPLFKTEEDGTQTPVLAWKIDGDLHVHPDRKAELMRAVGVIEIRKNPPPWRHRLPLPGYDFGPSEERKQIQRVMEDIAADLDDPLGFRRRP